MGVCEKERRTQSRSMNGVGRKVGRRWKEGGRRMRERMGESRRGGIFSYGYKRQTRISPRTSYKSVFRAASYVPTHAPYHPILKYDRT